MVSAVRNSPVQVRTAAAGLLWLMLGALALTYELQHPGLRGLVGMALLLLAPLLLLSIARLPVYLLAVYAMLVPFNDLLDTGAGPTLTRILAIIAAGCLVLWILFGGRVVKPSRAVIALAALTLYLGVTVFWAIDQRTALNALFIYGSQAGLFAAIAIYPFSRKDLVLLVGAMLAGAFAQSVYGGYLFSHGAQIWESRLYIGSEAAHSIDPNAFATALIAPSMLTLIFFLRAPSWLGKLLAFSTLAVMLFAFMASGSRGAAIGLAAAIGYLVWRPHFRLGMFVSIAAALIAAGASPLGHRFVEADVMTANGRLDIWKVGFASLSQYWLSGAGIGNFNNAFVQYYFATPHMWLPWDRVAHSIFLQSAVEGGIAGFALFLVFWYVQFRELSDVRADHPFADTCIALRAGVLGLFVAGFSLNLMEYKFTWLLFSLIAVTRTVLAGGEPSRKPQDGFE